MRRSVRVSQAALARVKIEAQKQQKSHVALEHTAVTFFLSKKTHAEKNGHKSHFGLILIAYAYSERDNFRKNTFLQNSLSVFIFLISWRQRNGEIVVEIAWTCEP